MYTNNKMGTAGTNRKLLKMGSDGQEYELISIGDPYMAVRLSKVFAEKILGVSGLSWAHSPVLSSQVLLDIEKDRQSGVNSKERKKGKNRGEGHKQCPAAMPVSLCWPGRRHVLSTTVIMSHTSWKVPHKG